MPIVTRISEQKRRPNRRNVYLDGSFAFGCNVNVIAKFRLREGLSLTREELDQIERGEVRQGCFDEAMRFLQGRLHSRSELKKKLMRKEHGEAIIDGVLDDLQRMSYLDDEKFAATKAASAAVNKHHGKRRAYQELMRSGVDKQTAERALTDVYANQDTHETAKQLALKQLPRLQRLEPAAAKRRLVGMLQRRGFDGDDIWRVVEEVLGRGSEE